jgi:hypothetical protein
MLQRPPEPVQLGDHELIAFSRDQQCLLQPGPAGELARGLVGEHLLATGRGQRVVLGLGMLLAC